MEPQPNLHGYAKQDVARMERERNAGNGFEVAAPTRMRGGMRDAEASFPGLRYRSIRATGYG
jgi:hypothetical protein